MVTENEKNEGVFLPFSKENLEGELGKDFIDVLRMVAPGTSLRVALDDFLNAKMGALIVFDNGNLEQIIEGVTGEFMRDQTWESLVDVILHFDPAKYDSKFINLHAQQFSTERFVGKINGLIEQLSENFNQTDNLSSNIDLKNPIEIIQSK